VPVLDVEIGFLQQTPDFSNQTHTLRQLMNEQSLASFDYTAGAF